jgi:uncharacterized lipoprotein YddW (UPF0748 family)
MKGRWALAALLALSAAACGKDATRPEPPVDPDEVPSPAREGRALWISRFDWAGRDELVALIDSAAAANFNLIYFQARGRADAYYQPGLEPWAHRPPAFVLGRDPGWDPLGVAIQRAHSRGLELHVWVNALIGWCGSEAIPETSPRHVLLQHPEWKMVDQNGGTVGEGCNFLTPGDPKVRSWLAAVVADIARRYPIDGMHLDYIRYPDRSFSFDSLTLKSWELARQTDPALNFDEHRRRLVTAAVREVRDSLSAARRAMPLSAAVWGIYKNTRGWSGVSTGYDSRFQDSRDWLNQGIIDVIAPMIYWPIKPTYGDRLDFAYLADEFASLPGAGRVYVGMGSEFPPESFCMGCDPVKQIYRARKAKAEGVSVYSGQTVRYLGRWGAIRAGPFKARVPIPPTRISR